jgi:hypothetical protein
LKEAYQENQFGDRVPKRPPLDNELKEAYQENPFGDRVPKRPPLNKEEKEAYQASQLCPRIPKRPPHHKVTREAYHRLVHGRGSGEKFKAPLEMRRNQKSAVRMSRKMGPSVDAWKA